MGKANNFVKRTEPASRNLSSEEKIKLNRIGNRCVNEGNWEQAEKVFRTTGYTAGLLTVAEHCFEIRDYKRSIDLYKLADDTDKLELIYRKLARALSLWLDK